MKETLREIGVAAAMTLTAVGVGSAATWAAYEAHQMTLGDTVDELAACERDNAAGSEARTTCVTETKGRQTAIDVALVAGACILIGGAVGGAYEGTRMGVSKVGAAMAKKPERKR